MLNYKGLMVSFIFTGVAAICAITHDAVCLQLWRHFDSLAKYLMDLSCNADRSSYLKPLPLKQTINVHYTSYHTFPFVEILHDMSYILFVQLRWPFTCVQLEDLSCLSILLWLFFLLKLFWNKQRPLPLTLSCGTTRCFQTTRLFILSNRPVGVAVV